MPSDVLETQASDAPKVAAGRRARFGVPRPGIDFALAVGLGALVFVVHPFGYLTRHPYWVDEAWVALLSRAPLRGYVGLSSSTPIGWLALVRFAPVGSNGLRIVPLLFAGGDVAMAYVVARGLRWRTTLAARVAGAVSGVFVLLVPISLVQHDLKQYTCDAFCTLVIVALALRVEERPSTARLAWLAAASAVAVGFSTVSAFVSVAVFAGLVVGALAARSVRQVRDIVVAAAATGGALALYLGFVVLPQTNQALRDYWHAFYLSGGLFHELNVAWQRLGALSGGLAAPAWLFVALLVLGLFVIAGLGHKAVALGVLLLWTEMFVVATMGRYPFLDRRTSHFLLILSVTVIGIGVAGVLLAVAGRSRIAAAALAGVVFVSLGHDARPYLRSHSIVNEDVRDEVTYVARHRLPNDVVVVSLMGSYGFAYYWPGAKVSYSVDHTGKNSNGYFARVTNVPDLVYTQGRAESDTTTALQQATHLAAAHGARSRIWIIRTHLTAGESHAWTAAFAGLHLREGVYFPGREPVAFVDVAGPAKP